VVIDPPQIKRRVCYSSDTVLVAFMSGVPMLLGSAFTLATLVLVVVVAHFNSWDQFFFTFLKSFQTFLLGFTV